MTHPQDKAPVIGASVEVRREKIYPLPPRPGFAWYWVYVVDPAKSPDGRRFDNGSIVELRRVLKRAYGRDIEIVEPWKLAAESGGDQ